MTAGLAPFLPCCDDTSTTAGPRVIGRIAQTVAGGARAVALAAAIGTNALAGPIGAPTSVSSVSIAPTSAGVQINPDAKPAKAATAAMLAQLRQLSGLTWEQLARLFGVNRRSVHFWAQGGALNARNLEQLGIVLRQVRGLSTEVGGRVDQVRAALVSTLAPKVQLLETVPQPTARKAGVRSDGPQSSPVLPPAEVSGDADAISLIDRLSSSSARIPGTEGRTVKRVDIKRKRNR